MQPIEWRSADAAALLIAPTATSHKYTRGVLGLRTGSNAYPGAAVLGAEAAWRTGIGLVCYFAPHEEAAPALGLPTPAAAILAKRPETVFSQDFDKDQARCDAWLIGSGTDPARRGPAEQQALLALLAGTAPIVVDAGALDLVAQHQPQAATIITPHRGEFNRLWVASGLDPVGLTERETAELAPMLASALNATVLLKGAITVAAAPSGEVYAYGPATPWLATAGTGDVLAGILGALATTHALRARSDGPLLAQLGVTAALLHDTAARLASGDPKAHGEGAAITAFDVAEKLPRAVQLVRSEIS